MYKIYLKNIDETLEKRKVQGPDSMLGDIVDVYVMSVDVAKKRISLSIKEI